ncbi:MAG: hypothetical protein JST04_01885 [Bdellovibrionales bacterium]|nr:hypothetical protein [Bdellovibrionales bacterium]
MAKPFASLAVGALLAGLTACATTSVQEPAPGAPASSVPQPTEVQTATDPTSAAILAVGAATQMGVQSAQEARERRERETKTNQGTITFDCSVKLPDDPTDNPELCRSFQMEVVDETGAEAARFRFGTDARYRFSGKLGKRYRLRPMIGKNWEFSVEPDRDLAVGERAKIQLKQKQ